MEKKSRILYIKRYLETQTDEEHPATLKDILTHLEKEGIKADRRAVSADIDLLIESGVDIVRNTGRQHEYFCGGNHFELPEIKLLIDAVQASRFITAQKSDALISKLSAHASIHQSEQLNRHIYVDKQIKSNNEQAYLVVDKLHAAINSGTRVRFKYYEYSPTREKIYKHDGQIYEFSPYCLIWNGDHYYAAGYSKHHNKVITFRVDRIAGLCMTDKPAVPRPYGFDMAFYARSVFQMYDGPVSDITLLCENRHMKTIVDRFGEDVQTTIADEDHFTASVQVAISPTFFGWVFSFCGGIRVIAPEEAAAGYCALITHAAENPLK